ncbi:MAG TPA: NADPH-dependent glutamate synthase [Verrucomicrobiota bacterium]|nr:NADPH-dependent glutamate synthase [Verrucomicrobiota bacterium]
MPDRLSTKQRLQIHRQKMPEQDPSVRTANFHEVNLGFSEQLALLEAQRCLQCKDPRCVKGCPVGVNIPRFIRLLSEGRMAEAAQSLLCDNALPGITGRVCPQEIQCESECIRANKGQPVGIGYLERYVADWARTHLDHHHHDAGAESNPPSTQHQVPASPPTVTPDASAHPITSRSAASTAAGRKRVAIVGSGPAGLTAAGELARRGYEVTIYEALHKPGGVLVYGIPEFRLPKAIVAQEVQRLEAAGVRIECNVIIGRTFTIPELLERFHAVFIANGAGLPIFMNVPGENLKGVYSANEYLTRVNLMAAYQFPKTDTPVLHGQRVAVVGGGNVAMNAVRTARRLGARESMIVYRRTRNELPARAEEVHHAEEEGVRFHFQTAPSKVIGNSENWVTGLECIRMKPGAPDESGRARPEPIPGSEFTLPCDIVVVAIGTRANPLLTSTCPDLKLNRRGNLVVDENGMTSVPGVFAGGDIVRGSATVILAMGDGKRAAQSIDRYLNG